MINNLFLIKVFILTFSLRYGIASQDVSTTADSDGEGGSPQREMLQDLFSSKSYQFGSKGPCGKYMIFYHHPLYEGYGFCDCDQGVKSKYPCSDHPVRRMIYIPSKRQCYPIFSKGPCKKGFWLQLGEEDKPECQPNKCLSKELDNSGPGSGLPDPIHQFWFYDPRRKSCYKSQTRGYCPVGLTLEVTHDSLLPKCRKKICFSKLTNFRSFLTCKPGSRYSYFLKGCVGKPSPLKYYGIG